MRVYKARIESKADHLLARSCKQRTQTSVFVPFLRFRLNAARRESMHKEWEKERIKTTPVKSVDGRPFSLP